MSKLKTAILFGGRSGEHEISLLSASAVIRNIPRERHDVLMVGITKDGRWLKFDGEPECIADGSWETSGKTTPCILSPDLSHGGFLLLRDGGCTPLPVDAVFPVLHGENGEDGTVQGMLQLAGIPYVGCDVASSANCMDKETAHILLRTAGLPCADWIAVRAPLPPDLTALARRVAQELGYPVFVKPAGAGSSLGVTKVKDADGLQAALQEALRYDSKALIEAAMRGREVECAVLGGSEPVASIIGEIVPESEFYDYNAKYKDGTTKLNIPAALAPQVAENIRETALAAFKAMGCEGMARVDFFADGGEIKIIELNTIPGFTAISMYPKLLEQTGVPYGELIDRLIRIALKRAGK